MSRSVHSLVLEMTWNPLGIGTDESRKSMGCLSCVQCRNSYLPSFQYLKVTKPQPGFEPGMSRIRDRRYRCSDCVDDRLPFFLYRWGCLLTTFTSVPFSITCKYKRRKINWIDARCLRMLQSSTVHLRKDGIVRCSIYIEWRCDIFSSHRTLSIRVVTRYDVIKSAKNLADRSSYRKRKCLSKARTKNQIEWRRRPFGGPKIRW